MNTMLKLGRCCTSWDPHTPQPQIVGFGQSLTIAQGLEALDLAYEQGYMTSMSHHDMSN